MPCEHGFPKPEQCVDCMYDGPVSTPTVPASAPKIDSVFTATFDGQCPACDLPIHVGQRIARMNHGGYVHFSCT